ncbi:MAG TPA: glycosyl hydrolase family protein [Bacteroidetes bacterium]|nr:glycosyl hydrolase family protein [Bacteroidota bacterium]
MKNAISFSLTVAIFFLCCTCSSKISQTTILEFNKSTEYKFKYFSNGHLGNGKYKFRTVEKGGRIAGEIVRASDAAAWSGMYSFLAKPIYLSDGKQFTVDVWMDHIGSFTLKLEDSPDGGANTSISVKNTKINQWETLLFDFSDAVIGGPSYTKIAVFVDLNSPATGKDVYNYFSEIKQIAANNKAIISGDKSEAVKIVVLGSSTAAGTGPSDTRNAWVNRFRRKLQSQNGYHQVINLAVGGYTTYHLLPSGTMVEKGKPQPNNKHNITMALSLNPDAVIINLPSNDAAKGFSLKEQLDNYTKICKPLYERGIPFWVSTPQGRNMEKEKRELQKTIMDSTYIRYGRRTLDFWRGLADWSGNISKKYNSGDGIHLNDEGHRLLFEEVWSKDILGAIYDKRKGIIKKDTAYATPIYHEGYVLTWKDEFDENKLDENIWTHELGDGCPRLCGWGNNEKVWYRPENSQVKNGKLIITAKPDFEKTDYWSASRIVTRGKVDFRFGRIDIRAKLPETKGLWPALWLLGINRETEDWPYCGEIDIMEEVGHIPYRVRGTVHYKNNKGWLSSKGDKYELEHNNFSDDFHVFSIDWNEKGIKFFVDEQQYAERKYIDLDIDPNDNPFLKPFYLIINCAVGGNLPGDPDATSVFPQTFEIDYVRYFQKNKMSMAKENLKQN